MRIAVDAEKGEHQFPFFIFELSGETMKTLTKLFIRRRHCCGVTWRNDSR